MKKLKKGSHILIYIILRVLVLLIMIEQIRMENYSNVFLCVMTLLLFAIPSFLNKKLNIVLPDAFEIAVLLFIFAAGILGEIKEYYITVPYWDAMLHTLNGFLMSAIGFSLVNILNDNEKIDIKMSPLFVALTAFCFSMTIGVVWEFFEFAMDRYLLTDMQKDSWISVISSIVFNPDGKNVPIHIQIKNMTINGLADFGHGAKSFSKTYPKYLDVGVTDTMKDLFVNFIGAVIFSTIGGIYLKNKGKGWIADKFIPRWKKNTK